MRVKGGFTTRRRHKKIFARNKGFIGRQKNVWKIAKQADMKAGTHAYVGRKLKKRQFRSLWIQRINAAARAAGTSYARLMNGLTQAKVVVDRKQLAEMAVSQPEVFAKLVETAKGAQTTPARKA